MRGEGAAPLPQMHSQNMLRDSRLAEKHLVPLDSYVFVSRVHKSFGSLGSYLFWGLRFIKDLAFIKLVVFIRILRFREFWGFLFLLASCVNNFWGVSGS